MSAEAYEVKVLAFLSPHHVWTLPSRPSASGNRYSIEHVGLYGAVGQDLSLNATYTKLEWQPKCNWVSATDDAMTELLLTASRVMFTPKMVLTHGSIFDDNIYKFGEISIEDCLGHVTHLSEYLKKKEVAMLSNGQFETMLLAGQIPAPLTASMTENIIENLKKVSLDIPINHWKKIIDDQTTVFSARSSFEAKIKTECTPFAAEKIIKCKQRDWELCKGVELPYLGVARKARVREALPPARLRRITSLLARAKNHSGANDSPCSIETKTNQEKTIQSMENKRVTKTYDYVPKTVRPTKKNRREVIIDPWTKREMERENFKDYAEQKLRDATEAKKEVQVDTARIEGMNKTQKHYDFVPKTRNTTNNNYINRNQLESGKQKEAWSFSIAEDDSFYDDDLNFSSEPKDTSFESVEHNIQTTPKNMKPIKITQDTSSESSVHSGRKSKMLELVAAKRRANNTLTESELATSSSSDDIKSDIKRLQLELQLLKK